MKAIVMLATVLIVTSVSARAEAGLSEVFSGTFVFDKSTSHPNDSNPADFAIVDVHDAQYTALVTVSVKQGGALLKCYNSKIEAYTLFEGNSVTLRCFRLGVIMADPKSSKKVSGEYRVQLVQSKVP